MTSVVGIMGIFAAGFSRMPLVILGGVLTVLVLGLVVGPRRQFHGGLGESKVDVAKLTTRRFVDEAYPAWLAQHPGRMCPLTLYELAPYIDRLDIADPWGGAYQLRCTQYALEVRSLGEDGLATTRDDIRSND